MTTEDGILMIEPSSSTSIHPLIDEITKKMTAAWRNRRQSKDGYRGVHQCKCGVMSDNKDHWVVQSGTELLTNSLCVHYLAYHRDEVPASELEKVKALPNTEANPTEDELLKPRV